MLLDCVLTSCNNNPLYSDFIPIFIEAWKKLYPHIDIKIIFIADATGGSVQSTIPKEFIQYSDHIILFTPPKFISTAFVSQYIRLLYPALLEYENGVLITDMDMIPMNSTYYSENIRDIDNDKFIYLRNVLFNINQVAMCYNVATPKKWGEIFGISSLNDVIDTLTKRYCSIKYDDESGGLGWSTDQLDLYRKVFNRPDFVYLNDKNTGFYRLDRAHIREINKSLLESIASGVFSDYHMLRPYTKYKNVNDMIVNAIPCGSTYTNFKFLRHIFKNNRERNEIKIIVEAGTRDGRDAIALSKIFPNAHIYTFECNPETVEVCKKNLEGIESITFIDKGLGEDNLACPFYSYTSNNPGASSFFKRIDSDRTQKRSGFVDIIKLSDFLEEKNITEVDLLCLDVQGYELNILKGCELKQIKNIILEMPKDVINEEYLPKGMYSKYIGAPSPMEIRDFLEKNGFEEKERVEENKIEDNVLYSRGENKIKVLFSDVD